MKPNNLGWAAVSRFRAEIMGFMCILIVLFHFENNMVYPAALTLVNSLLEFGNVGVDVFLFVSGIGLYFSFEKERRLLPFYKKRLIRILIPYVLLCVPYYIWLNTATERNLLFLDVTQLSLPLKGMISTWFLPAITVFYLLFPLIYKLQQQKNNAWRITATAFMCLGWIAALLVFNKTHSEIYHNCEIALTRLLIFMVGCCFGKFVLENKKIPLGLVILSGIYIAVYPFLYHKLEFTIFKERLTYVPLAIAITIVLAFLFSFFNKDNYLFRVLRFFGKHSLEIYVTHVLINNVWCKTVGARHFDRYGIIDYALIVAASLLLSVAAHIVITKLTNIFINPKGKLYYG